METLDLPNLPEHSSKIDEHWQELKRTGSQTARERLILHYASLVRYVVDRVAARLPPAVERADLVSYGMFGLMEAIDKFDPGREGKFEIYALARIKEAILTELRAEGVEPSLEQTASIKGLLGISRETLEGPEMQGSLSAAINSLSGREKIVMTLYHFEGLTLAEIGEVLGVTESRVREIHTKAVHSLRDLLRDVAGKERQAPTDETPRCPRCRSELAETAIMQTLDLPVQGSDEKRTVSFAYCRRCGTWLGTV
ncbi:MAG: sigma-70 family RNA polymerase sigma factor [Actinomycetota bacterium]